MNVGDEFRARMAGGPHERIATYRVLQVFANGTLFCTNVATGKERSFTPAEFSASHID